MDQDTFPGDRQALRSLLFPAGVPSLWAPTLVFYQEDGSIDQPRLRAHLAFMAPHVKGLLAGGSTGDAWETDDAGVLALLDTVVPAALEHGTDLLIGALRPTVEEMTTLLDKIVDYLCHRAGTTSVVTAFAEARVRGITIAPPTTATPMAQSDIGDALAPLFARGLPMALYQLPQVTKNTMMPALVAELAARFPNFLLFKDSGGVDEVALSGLMPADIMLLRGAEGDFARWAKSNRGCYDGFLLSSANSVPGELAAVLRDLAAGRVTEAEERSIRTTIVIADAFASVAGMTRGNAFANANKALSHIMAYGQDALEAPPPRLHAGGHLPHDVLVRALRNLTEHGLMPTSGYMSKV